MSIFCDGACSGNGRKGAVGGWGWAYWSGPVRASPDVAAADRLDIPPGLPATNQRAELTALLKVLRWLSTNAVTSVNIYTDSMYTINCTSVWGPAWKKAGWKRKTGEPLLNLDLIVPLVELWRPAWALHHVRGHQTNASPEAYGNNWVDQAAVAGAEGRVLVPGPYITAAATATATPIGTTATVKAPVLPAKLTLAGPVKQTDLRSWFS
jgi:ribonuclease HI